MGVRNLQRRYLNQDYSVYGYLMITPAGGHVELRQVGATSIYESADGSYVQLTDNGSTKLLRDTSGTQYTFVAAPTNGEFNCIQIEDRNGNYISASYNGNGDISTVSDTLGRTITFNYDTANYLTSISQTWTINGQPQEHRWAAFGYSTLLVQTNFPGLFVQGPSNRTIPVLSSVMLADNSQYTFDYN